MEFKKWTKIEQFHNIRKSIKKLVDYKKTVGQASRAPVIHYRGKVKLDGTNAAIRLCNDEVRAQSRSRFITPDDDNYGFAAWVESKKDGWLMDVITTLNDEMDFTIYGEWCGKGIQKRCAISQVGPKFVIFAMTMDDRVIYEPAVIGALLQPDIDDDVFILPWYDTGLRVDFSDDASVNAAVDYLNGEIEKVEKCDPWVKSTFGIEGLGEGLVYYSYNVADPDGVLPEDFCSFFKVKGDEHKSVRQIKPVLSDPEVVKSIEDFAEKFVTQNRCEQALHELGLSDPTVKDTGKFLKWMGNDVESESKDELEVVGLAWKDVAKQVNNRAKTWLFSKIGV